MKQHETQPNHNDFNGRNDFLDIDGVGECVRNMHRTDKIPVLNHNAVDWLQYQLFVAECKRNDYNQPEYDYLERNAIQFFNGEYQRDGSHDVASMRQQHKRNNGE